MWRCTWLMGLCLLKTCAGQTALPHLTPLKSGDPDQQRGSHHVGCMASDVNNCKMNCLSVYHDTTRYTCPCYSKMGECLVRIGCSYAQRKNVMASCTRKGYCKAGYCSYRVGDYTPKNNVRPEIFSKYAVVPPSTPCVDGCCPGNTCTENPKMKALREPGRAYRLEEIHLPPRYGDPRLSVNQNFNLMPYSIPLSNIPAVNTTFLSTFAQESMAPATPPKEKMVYSAP